MPPLHQYHAVVLLPNTEDAACLHPVCEGAASREEGEGEESMLAMAVRVATLGSHCDVGDLHAGVSMIYSAAASACAPCFAATAWRAHGATQPE